MLLSCTLKLIIKTLLLCKLVLLMFGPISNVIKLFSLETDFLLLINNLNNLFSIHLPKLFSMILLILVVLTHLLNFILLQLLYLKIHIVHSFNLFLIISFIDLFLFGTLFHKLFDFGSELLVICYQKFSPILHLVDTNLMINSFLFDDRITTIKTIK